MATPDDTEFEELLRYIQESRAVDFRGYKRTSLRRRIIVRMEQVGVDSFGAYQSFLEANGREFAVLLDTILINVSAFFRDEEGWAVLRDQVVPEIIARTQDAGSIRVWSAGCASGQEPYSVAMLFAEALGVEEFCRRVKVYGTDLDEAALHQARQATYAPREVENVPPALLDKYFERTNNHYVLHRDLRRCVIFGRHNVVHDAPISRIDLLLCRNLLIYLEFSTQDVVLPRLHYALTEDGVLFLGKAETQLARSALFQPLAPRHRLFRKQPQPGRRLSVTGFGAPGAPSANSEAVPSGALLRAALEHSNNALLLVEPDGRLVFSNAAARRILEVGEGDHGRPFQDLSISYRPAELRGPMEEAQRARHTVRLEHLIYHRPPADPIRLSADVTPLFSANSQFLATLLAFTDTTDLFALQQELALAQESLETTIEELQSSNEELETTNEELQSTNEELETTNEELQSTNEELETTNEELQSANEEMEATNEELRRQSEDAAEYRSYAESVLRSIDAGIMVLDGNLRVSSWNRWCENVWGLRAEEAVGQHLGELDVGLPVQALRAHTEAAAEQLDAAQDIMMDGMDRRGRTLRCRVRIQPLLRGERTAEGVVVIFEDLTAQARQEDHARTLGRVLGKSLNEIYFLDPASLRFTLVNQGAEQKLGYGIAQLRQMSLAELMPGVPVEALRTLAAPLLAGERSEVVFETVLRARTGREYPAEICLQHFANEQPPILLAIVHDTTERQSLLQAAND